MPGATETAVARAVTEVFAPAVLVTLVLLLQPLIYNAVTWPQALVAVLFVTGLPFTLLLWMTKRGKITDHHVAVRAQRPPLMVMAGLSLGAGVLVLSVLDAPRILFAQLGSIFLGLVLSLLANLVWKLSVHSAVAAYAALLMLLPVPVVGAPLALIVSALTAWSRIILGAHTPTQVLAGQFLGCFVYAAGQFLF